MSNDGTIEHLEAQIAALKARLDEAETAVKITGRERDQARAAQQLSVAAAAAGVLPEAIQDIINRAIRTGEWKEDSKGELVRFSEGFPDIDASGSRITPKNIMNAFRKEVPFYWQQGQEAPAAAEGAASSSKPATAPDGRTWKQLNLTEQSQLFRRDPQHALALATAAGVPLAPGLRVGEMPKSK